MIKTQVLLGSKTGFFSSFVAFNWLVFFQRFKPECERNCGLAISSTAKLSKDKPIAIKVKAKQGDKISHQAPTNIEEEVWTL